MPAPTDRPRVSKEPISALLPAFNQAASLEPIAEGWLRALGRLGRPFELIVIDDGSADGTAAAADGLAARQPAVRVLRHEKRRGFGACLRTGLAVAQYPLVFYTACDYPYPPADLTKLLAVIDSSDLVSGARTDPMPVGLRRLGQVYRLLIRVLFGITLEPRPGWHGWRAWWRGVRLRLVFGLRLHDVPSAYKLFRRPVLDRIPIQSDGEFIHAEVLAKANFLGCLIHEEPIGRLAGNFRGVPEPAAPGAEFATEARRVFRRPEFRFEKPPEATGTAAAEVPPPEPPLGGERVE
jgi:glycosyltransferase involved in cell wall biosynthesis